MNGERVRTVICFRQKRLQCIFDKHGYSRNHLFLKVEATLSKDIANKE